jgi:hypothetical protein
MSTRGRAVTMGPVLQPVQDEFFRPGEYSSIPLVLLHDRVIGRLPDPIAAAIGLTSAARDVGVGAEVLRHIFQRRQVACVDDVMVCLNRLEDAFSHLSYLVTEGSTTSVFALLGLLTDAQRYLLLPIKLVQAARARSGIDELWLRTAHPCGAKTLRGYQRRDALRPLPSVEPASAADDGPLVPAAAAP